MPHHTPGPEPDALDPLARAQLLLTVLDEGRRTATYKLALLLALLDCSLLGVDPQGRPPTRLPTRALANRVLELYWRQVRDRPGATDVYRQSSQPRAVTVDAVRALWVAARAAGLTSFSLVRTVLGEHYQQTLDTVELNLVQMPLGRLQRPAGSAPDYPRFLYDDAPFHAGVTARQLARAPLHVDLQPGVGAWLISLGGLLRPLLEVHWTRAVARFNDDELVDDRLRDFLFGAERENLVPVREGLREAQNGCCFYCGDRLQPRAVEVDHFIPWSRIPNDALGNLVLADSRCNNSKRNHYADIPLLVRWATRPATPLEELAAARGWPLQVEQSHSIARGLYAQLPVQQNVWVAPGVFTVLDRDELLLGLETLA